MSDEPNTKLKHESELVKEIGLYAVKAVVTLCSGGFLVVLTFLGTIHESTSYTVDIGKIIFSLKLLLLGITGAFGSLLASYLTAQSRLGNGGSTVLDNHPNVFLVVQAGPLLIGYCLFFAGAWWVLSAVTAT